MRAKSLLAVFLVAFSVAIPATLESLSTDELISRSTAIVRARITGSRALRHGPLVYTHFSIQVVENLKGQLPQPAEVVLPGGTLGSIRQNFAGVPVLNTDTEYLLFLWSSPNGLNHIIGLSQGVFSVAREADGELTAWRPAAAEALLDLRTGRLVADRSVTIKLSELRNRVAGLRPQGGAKQ